ncbi:hypothetical protein E2C01_081942 [Portunus trituberculatus]|uniref:Uncharacterized protein n=1 Tax=Portunus trituberculatus TaxID=210409 RepID=A0A5B7INN9_PORTR|nr:hypothetical protein [Portunus trituberculatus]
MLGHHVASVPQECSRQAQSWLLHVRAHQA